MKKRDIATLILIIGLSGALALVVSNSLLGGKKKLQLKVEVVDKINSTFPDIKSSSYTKFFNSNSINPTRTIEVGGDQNDKPLGEGATR